MNSGAVRALVGTVIFLLQLQHAIANSWAIKRPLNAPRHSHSATLLMNGTVLIAGGISTHDGVTNSAEIYDPSTGDMTLTGSMSTGRWDHAAVLLQNGEVLVSGGLGTSNTLSTAELYSVSSGEWELTAPMKTARIHHTATLLPNGNVLVVGGTDQNGNATNACELYNPVIGSWTATCALQSGRFRHTATLLRNGTVLVTGGFGAEALSSTEVYHPDTGNWTPGPFLKAERVSATATLLLDGRVLVAGGLNGIADGLASAELYDPDSPGWTSVGSMNAARAEHTATLLGNGSVLAAGGIAIGPLSSVELYNPESRTWVITDQLNTNLWHHRATRLNNGFVLATGGQQDASPTALVQLFTNAIASEILIRDSGLNAAIRDTLHKPDGVLTHQDLLSLTNLSGISRGITSLQGLGAARNLQTLLLDDNQLTNSSFFTELAALGDLSVLDLSENPFTDLALPGGLTNLTRLRIEEGHLSRITLPAGLTELAELRLGANRLTDLPLPRDMTNLSVLSLYLNQFTNLVLPPNLKSLTELNLDGNQFSQFALPAGLSGLTNLMLGGNQLISLTVPADMTNLVILRLNDNQLTNLALPAGLNRLVLLFALGNHLRNFSLPAGLSDLAAVYLTGNPLTNFTIPPEVTKLATLVMDPSTLRVLVLPEPLVTTDLAAFLGPLRDQGVSIITYPLTVHLVGPVVLAGAFEFAILGPPGIYSVLHSTNLPAWNILATATNALGSITFIDVNTNSLPVKLYAAYLQSPPSNMVFIAPNTFTMGSPPTEQDRDPNEGPQTLVTLTHGFWIGKYEVTQAEYLSVMGVNPSQFPSDLSRPVSSVSWQDATNYCARLTEREFAAGRISTDTRYRLPTEAEWECAARAGTSTRFSYGDDSSYADLPNYAWQAFDGGLTVHPVGRKLPNRWGLYDMAGNVFEWCQDWLGPLPGGSVTDPSGADSNPIGWKVMRGGAFDFGGAACRSASRNFFGNHPALTDWNLGFRVVLTRDP